MFLKNDRYKFILQIFVVIFLTVVYFSIVYQIWNYDFRVPYPYTVGEADGDGLFVLSTIKGVFQTGWYIFNPYLGAPFGREMYDFPLFTDITNILMIRFFSIFFDDYVHLANFLSFLTFPVTSGITFYVLKKRSFSFLCSLGGALCFTFLPARILRLRVGHLFLADYSFIPIIVLIFFWLFEDERFLKPEKHFFRYKRNLFAIVFFPLFSLKGIYYSFFACFFLLVVLLWKVMTTKKIKSAISCSFAMLGLIVPIVIAYIPHFLFFQQNGVNPMAPVRFPHEAEMLSLGMVDMMIPKQTRQIPFLEALHEKYHPLTIVGGVTYWGIAGTVGFFVLVLSLLKRETPHENSNSLFSKPLTFIGKMQIFGILLGIVGGIGPLFALFVSPQIRDYSRLSVYLSFFTLIGLCSLITFVSKRIKKRPMQWIFILFVIAFFTFSLWEQTLFQGTDYDDLRDEYLSDSAFVQTIETTLGEDALVFQLPYQWFPETPPIERMADYSHTRGYLHSDTLRWSYGSYKGREVNTYFAELMLNPIEVVLGEIVELGFSGIYVDTFGYTEQDLEILEEELSDYLNTTKIVSANERLWFFDMQNYAPR